MIIPSAHVRGVMHGLLWLSLLVLPSAAHAQLQAGPTLLEIAGGSSTELLLRNAGDEPVAAQVRVYDWSQPDGEDRLVPTDDLAISPPIAELAPGGRQIVRIVPLAPAPADRDGTYRVVVDELPQGEQIEASRVAFRMRYVIPLFRRVAGTAPPALSCHVEAGGSTLLCENSGGRAAQLGASQLVDDNGTVMTLSKGLFGYVLPGSRRIWTLSGPPPEGAGLRLEARLNGQPTTLAVARQP